MKYNNLFNNPAQASQLPKEGAGDFRSGPAYVFNPDMELAISAAAATQRPLLVTGPAGCGKSSLARGTAHRLKWRYLERMVNSRTEVSSLLWEVDHVQRLQDAQAQTLDKRLLAYVRSSVLWNALDQQSAQQPLSLLTDDSTENPPATPDPAVVLVDEIDKADPDLPNNLLEVLGGLRFEVADTGRFVTCRDGVPLIVITSNDERDLPPAFVRRCICLNLQQPDLASVGKIHFPEDPEMVEAALGLVDNLKSTAARADRTAQPSAAEFLDFVQACKQLQVRTDSEQWLKLAEVCMLKGETRGITAPSVK